MHTVTRKKKKSFHTPTAVMLDTGSSLQLGFCLAEQHKVVRDSEVVGRLGFVFPFSPLLW